jgi:hypothetical protein
MDLPASQELKSVAERTTLANVRFLPPPNRPISRKATSTSNHALADIFVTRIVLRN